MSEELFSALDQAVRGADAGRVRELVIPLDEKERRAVAKRVAESHQALRWSWDSKQSGRRRAAVVAFAGTATARKLSAEGWSLTAVAPGGVDDGLYEVIASRGPSFAEDLARMLLRDEGPTAAWPLVRRAVREELIPPPENEEGYVRGMIFAVALGRGNELDAVYRGLVEDPGLLDDVWRLFEHDVGGDLAHAKTWQPREGGGFTPGANRWTYALRRLADEGRIDRDRLLDASLDALNRDFRPSGIRWYAQLHEELAPSREERTARLERYLALLASPAPAALQAGLTGIKALENVVSAEDLARAAGPALTQPRKADAVLMLRLLERAAKNAEPGRSILLAAAVQALGHDRADVQERALKLLERYPGDTPRADVLAYVDAVSATLRSRVEALTGFASEPAPVPAPELDALPAHAAIAVRARTWPEPRIPDPRPGRPLEPIESVDDLIELAAALLEGRGTGGEAERFLDGVSRLCAERPPRFRERTAGLARQAEALGQPAWGLFPNHPTGGARIVALVVLAWVRGSRAAGGARVGLGGLLEARALEVANRARRGVSRPLLSFPTHECGWIERERLEEREGARGRIFNRPDPVDRFTARLRAASGPRIELVPERTVGSVLFFGKPPERVGVRIGRFPDELAPAESAIVTPLHALGRDVREWYVEDAQWPVADALGARWLCTLLPGNPEVQFARGLTAIVDFIDGSPYRHPEAPLELMLEPGVPLRDPAWTAVAAALLAKSPDLRRIGTDVVLTSISDGRFDPEALGAGIAWLLGAGAGAITRIEAPLRDVGRISPLHAAQGVRALEAFVAAAPEGQRNLHVPLGVALELAAEGRIGLTDARARDAIARIAETASKSSKVGRAAHDLLTLESDERALDAVLRLAAAAADGSGVDAPRTPQR